MSTKFFMTQRNIAPTCVLDCAMFSPKTFRFPQCFGEILMYHTLTDLCLFFSGADTIANSGKDFMVDLLSKSLLGPNGLNVALDKVIDDLCQSRSKKLDSNVKEKSAADILVRFIEQLLKSICLEALGKLQNENKDNPCYPLIEEQCDELVKLAYRFQRLLVARLFRVTQSDRFWPARSK